VVFWVWHTTSIFRREIQTWFNCPSFCLSYYYAEGAWVPAWKWQLDQSAK
jgi:hypothetical protein